MSPKRKDINIKSGKKMHRSLFFLSMMACSDYDLIKRNVGDVFYQAEAGEVDILLVIDNSCSMQPYQEKLSENFDAFLTFFVEGNVDYRIGVATTTVGEPPPADGEWCTQNDVDAIPPGGELMGNNLVIDSTMTNGSELFSELVNVGTCGTGYEMGLEGALQVLENTSNPLLREEAYLSVIFVSDEQDASPLGVNDYINRIRAIKDSTARDAFNASSLVVQDPDLCTTEQVQSGATVGTRYIDFAEQSNGLVENICGTDFTSIVTDLSLNSSRLNDTFFLTKSPDLSTFVLGVDGEEVPCDSEDYSWRYELLEGSIPIIRFDRSSLPPPSSRITAEYNPGGGDPADFCGGIYAEEEELGQ
jgi:hypothetical protein